MTVKMPIALALRKCDSAFQKTEMKLFFVQPASRQVALLSAMLASYIVATGGSTWRNPRGLSVFPRGCRNISGRTEE